MRISRLAVCLTLLALAAGGASAAEGERIVNGTFARGALSGAWMPLVAGSQAIAGWSVVRGRVDYIGSYWSAPGGRSVDLDGTPGAGAIAQTIATTPGERYRLSFDLAGNPEGPPATKQLSVRAGSTSAVYTFDVSRTSRGAMGWRHTTLTFSAAARATTITFASLDAGRYAWNGPVIANVSVVPADANETQAPPPAATPATTPSPAPVAPHTMAPRPVASTSASFDGTYLADVPGRPVRMRVDQNGAHVVATALDANRAIPGGAIAWYGDVRGDRIVVLAACPDDGAVGWHGGVVTRTPEGLVLNVTDCKRALHLRRVH